MAIVKILKSSKVFAAVSYNDKRVKNGEAELVKAVNFGPLSSLIGYEDYLNHWGDVNKRIKNKQFHVTISLENNEKTKEDAMIACGRHCCICHKFCGNKMEVHHTHLKDNHKSHQ